MTLKQGTLSFFSYSASVCSLLRRRGYKDNFNIDMTIMANSYKSGLNSLQAADAILAVIKERSRNDRRTSA
jgi:hypothetical protein